MRRYGTIHDLDAQDELARDIIVECKSKHLTVSCAESLTGGLLADAFVRIPGASKVFYGSVNAYAYSAKTSILGVDAEHLKNNGAVNHETAQVMAQGACRVFSTHVAISTTGVAGPGPEGDISEGSVYLGLADDKGMVESEFIHCIGDRESVRRQAVMGALSMLSHYLRDMEE